MKKNKKKRVLKNQIKEKIILLKSQRYEINEAPHNDYNDESIKKNQLR